MTVTKEARALRPGDVVIGPFSARTVAEVKVQAVSVLDDDGWLFNRRDPVGVTVTWTGGTRTAFRLDAQVEAQS